MYDAFGGPLEVREVDEPDCPADAAVVRVRATGVCRSDWHAWQGHDADVTVPHVPGHEFSGTVDRVGADVAGWSAGQRVTTPFVSACGSCAQCRAGNHQVCSRQTQPGFTHWGSFADLVVVRNADVNLVALPDDVDDVTAAGLGCRFATAFRALTAHGRPEPDQWVAVHGCGGVGLSAVMIAVALGARVVVTDPNPAARAAASALGAEVVLDANGDAEALAADVREASAGGTHVSVDAIGSQTALAAGLAGLRPRGRHVQVGLLLGDDARPAVPLGRLVAEELSVHGSHGMSATDYPAMLAMVASGALQPQRLVGRVIGLDQAGTAVAAMSAAPAGAGMTVVRPGVLAP